jgi:hypothetical protein
MGCHRTLVLNLCAYGEKDKVDRQYRDWDGVWQVALQE